MLFSACLHGDEGLQVGEVARLGGVTRLTIQSLISSPQPRPQGGKSPGDEADYHPTYHVDVIKLN